MNRAAAELNTVQSNVTAEIKALEGDLGCVLFERRARGVSLTAAGQRLLPYADRAARLLADARSVVRDDGVPRGLLTIGSLETTAALRLTPLLAGYAAEYPEVDLVLRTGTTRELIGEVLEGRVDGAYVCGPVGHTELLEEVMFREELIMLAAPDVASSDEVMKKGEARIVVLRAGCSYRQILEALLARRGHHRGPAIGVRHIGGDFRLRRGELRDHSAAARVDRPSLERRPRQPPSIAAGGGQGRHGVHPPP